MRSIIKTVLFIVVLIPILMGAGYFLGVGIFQFLNFFLESDYLRGNAGMLLFIVFVSTLSAVSMYFLLRYKKKMLKEKGKTTEEERMIEPFYGAGTDDRVRVIASLALLGSLPVIIIYLLSDNLIAPWGSIVLAVSVFVLILVILIYSVLLFKKSRELFNRYELIITPAGFFIGSFFFLLYIIDILTSNQISTPEQINIESIALVAFAVIALILGGKLLLMANRTIFDKKAKAEEELNFASEIQEQFLQDRETEAPFLKSYGISRAAREVGGDFLFLDKKNDNTVVAATGDVSGHSFGAGLIMSMLITMIEDHLRYTNTAEGLLEVLNHKLYQQPKRNIFSTMNCVEADRDKVLLWNAGHMPLLKYSADTNNLEEIRHAGVALGMTSKFSYKPKEIPADSGDYFILYSDGLVETRNKQGTIRNEQHFYSTVQSVLNNEKNCRKAAYIILQKILDSDFSKYTEDDVTLILLNYQ